MADFGEILRTIGEFGLFQQLLLIALAFPNLLQLFLSSSIVFVEEDPERHCNTDWILRADPNLTTGEQLNLTVPREEDGTFSRCRMFVPVDWDIGAIREKGLNETTGCQSGWVYGKGLYEATIVTDFDLVCDKAYLVEVIQAIFMTGILFGFLIFGPFAESFGRRRAIQIPMVLLFIFIVGTALSPNVYLFFVFQFMMGIGGGGYRVNSIILCTEWMGVSKRSWGACVFQLAGAVGQCVLAGVVYAIRDWRLVQLITAAPPLVVLIYIWFIPESARWLLNRGKTEEAKQQILKAAAINKRIVPDSLFEKTAVTDNNGNKGSIKLIFRSSILAKYFFILSLTWFSVSTAIFSLYFNMGNFGFNIFLTQLLFGAIEIPAHILCMWLLEVLGRRILLVSTALSGGLSCLLTIAFPGGHATAVTSLAVIARFFLLWATSICNVYIQELFPTSVRQTATAMGNILGRIGGILAPLLNMLAMYHWAIPPAVFSSLTLVSGALCFLLPETRSKELPESAADAENIRNGESTHKAKCSSLTSTKL